MWQQVVDENEYNIFVGYLRVVYGRINFTYFSAFSWQSSAQMSQTYGPLSSVTWLQLLRKQTNTGTSTTLDCRITMLYVHMN